MCRNDRKQKNPRAKPHPFHKKALFPIRSRKKGHLTHKIQFKDMDNSAKIPYDAEKRFSKAMFRTTAFAPLMFSLVVSVFFMVYAIFAYDFYLGILIVKFVNASKIAWTIVIAFQSIRFLALLITVRDFSTKNMTFWGWMGLAFNIMMAMHDLALSDDIAMRFSQDPAIQMHIKYLLMAVLGAELFVECRLGVSARNYQLDLQDNPTPSLSSTTSSTGSTGSTGTTGTTGSIWSEKEEKLKLCQNWKRSLDPSYAKKKSLYLNNYLNIKSEFEARGWVIHETEDPNTKYMTLIDSDASIAFEANTNEISSYSFPQVKPPVSPL
jgi:hypothetical protein